MTSAEESRLGERLATLAAAIEALRERVAADASAATAGRDALREEVRRDAAESKAAHDKIDRKIDAMFKRTGQMDDRLLGVERDVRDMTPVVERLEQSEQRWIGVRRTLLVLWTGATVIAGLVVGYVAGGGLGEEPPSNPPFSFPGESSPAAFEGGNQ